jgi:hypothetical protein
MLEREEYIEQGHFFNLLLERIPQNVPLQDVLLQAKDEILTTTRLPLAIDYFLTELRHSGCIAPAMRRLKHYFSSFQAFLVESAEDERGRFDMRIAVQILRAEAKYRAEAPTKPGAFLFQFECLSRNRLSYDRGLLAITEDPIFDDEWREWIRTVRRQVGIVDFADLLYVRSQYYLVRTGRAGEPAEPEKPVLFGEKEGKIAWANRRKDPIYLFAALQRQLGYPQVPRLQPADPTPDLLPQMLRRMERLESRLKLLEEEQRKGAIDLPKFYQRPDQPPLDPDE